MRTSKSISTISYNTDEFLKNKIQYWVDIGLIEFGMWIRHQPEKDELKEHCHVFLKPAKLLQTMHLQDESNEYDPENPDKPLAMKVFRNSVESDWLLYAIHDQDYLNEKNLTRQHFYSFDDVQTTCEDTLNDIISRLSDAKKGRLEYRIIDCIDRGLSWSQIVRSGVVPIRYLSGARIMYMAITGKDNMDIERETL